MECRQEECLSLPAYPLCKRSCPKVGKTAGTCTDPQMNIVFKYVRLNPPLFQVDKNTRILLPNILGGNTILCCLDIKGLEVEHGKMSS